MLSSTSVRGVIGMRMNGEKKRKEKEKWIGKKSSETSFSSSEQRPHQHMVGRSDRDPSYSGFRVKAPPGYGFAQGPTPKLMPGPRDNKWNATCNASMALFRD